MAWCLRWALCCVLHQRRRKCLAEDCDEKEGQRVALKWELVVWIFSLKERYAHEKKKESMMRTAIAFFEVIRG